jgi:hypothetical protein
MDEKVMLEQLARAQECAVVGDRAEARALYADLWAATDRAADSYWACVVAHFMAHAQDTPEAQRDWHQRALQAAERLDDARVRAFYPSLHANLAEVYLRLDDHAPARYHLTQARAAAPALPDNGYDLMIGRLIARLTQALDPDRASGLGPDPPNTGSSPV